MRGSDTRQEGLFSYVSPETRIPKNHPLREIRRLTDEALAVLTAYFKAAYSPMGRPLIAPEKLIRALLLQLFYTVRSERLLMEQLDYNLLVRWFVGLGVDEPAWGRPCSRTTVSGFWRPKSCTSSSPRCWPAPRPRD